MPAVDRLEHIVALVDERGFLSVGELSQMLQVSEMTVRRDLAKLDEEKRLQRTYGGAVSLRAAQAYGETSEEQPLSNKPEGILLNRVDVLIASSVSPKYDGLLLERTGKTRTPVIAESLAIHNQETVVGVDNYTAGLDLGRWTAEYAVKRWNGQANILDLTYHLSNTQARSRGFIDGIHSILKDVEVVLSLDAQSRYETAYQLTRDALTVHPKINIIFTINDMLAWGAINACRDLNIDPHSLIILPFGLEGDTLKNALVEGDYCVVGLAMFPEIVGPVCIEAAIAAYNHEPLPSQLLTPYRILTPEMLPDFYVRRGSHWYISWDAVRKELSIPLNIERAAPVNGEKFPQRIGFIVPFGEHEWYRNLVSSMRDYARHLQIEFEGVDVDQNLRDEVDLRRRQIACAAAEQVQPDDVIIIDGGAISNYLAEALLEKPPLTIITNSMPVFDTLKNNPEHTLISTGGAYRRSSQVLVGPTAEGALRELRADKLFLMVSGITFNFGLSHTNISEVTIKQAMIRSAREVILLADHSFFGQESVVQVAPLTIVNKLVTDDALPASARLELMKQGIEIILATI